MTKTYLQSFVTLTRNEVSGLHLVFQKKRFQGFIFELLRVVKSLEGNAHFFSTPLGQPKFHESSNFPCSPVVLLRNFPGQFELCFSFKRFRSYKVLESR